ncbi:MAG TPA: hypothetical protein VJ750_02780 [Rhizomicrobium sp.]|nr:hypothetical protein [Rhizomicrobium sp.]
MSGEASQSPICGCQSGAHDHPPGQCPRINVGEDGLCDYCRERADANTRRTVALEGRATAMSSGRASLTAETGKFTLTPGAGVSEEAGGVRTNGVARLVVAATDDSGSPDRTVGLTGVEAKAEVGSLRPNVTIGLTGVEAQAIAGSIRADTALPLRAGGAIGQTVGGTLAEGAADSLLDATGRPVILGSTNIVEENDTLEARATVRPSTGTVTAGAEVNGVGATVDVGATFDAVVLPAIWHSQGVDLFLQIDRAAQELEAVRLLLLSLQSGGSEDMRGHNSLRGVLGAPDIDLETVEAAIQCLAVLRLVISQPQPDFEIVALLWRVILAALKAMGRLAAWAARTTKALFNDFLGTTMGKSFAKGFGTTMGASAAAGIVYEITQHGPEGLQAVGQVLKGVLAALGHPG